MQSSSQPSVQAELPPSARLQATPLHPLFAAALRGVDLKLPLAAATLAAIEQVIDRYAVVVFPAQHLADAHQLEFTRRFGPLEKFPVMPGKPLRLGHPDLFDVSNLDEHGNITPLDDERRLYLLANQLWHTDGSFRQVSARYSLLSAHVVPPDGADTEFADMRAAWDALPEERKAGIEGLMAEHSIWHSRAQLGGYVPTDEERRARPPAIHPLVRRHPGSGRNGLYLAAHASRIAGWPLAEGQALLAELMAFATQPRFIYRHRWQTGDIVLWDNRCTMHRATSYEDTRFARDMRRTTSIDVAPAAAAERADS